MSAKLGDKLTVVTPSGVVTFWVAPLSRLFIFHADHPFVEFRLQVGGELLINLQAIQWMTLVRQATQEEEEGPQ